MEVMLYAYIALVWLLKHRTFQSSYVLMKLGEKVRDLQNSYTHVELKKMPCHESFYEY